MSVRYGSETVLVDVSLAVAGGDGVALIGPNGAGKSTMLRAILGLVPLATGSVRILGRAPEDARRDIAYVPQVDALDREFPVSVLQVVLMGPKRTQRERAGTHSNAPSAREPRGASERRP